MGLYVHLHVVFIADRNDGVAGVAKKHLALLEANQSYELDRFEATQYLTALSQRIGKNPGNKGGLVLWGIVGNYVRADNFVTVLRPFWRELLTSNLEGGPCDFDHVLVFYEVEGSEAAGAYEIIYTDTHGEYAEPPETDNLIIRHHENLPFCWNQQ